METGRREIVLINRREPGPTNSWDTIERIARILSLAAIPVVLGIVGWLIQESLQKQTISRDSHNARRNLPIAVLIELLASRKISLPQIFSIISSRVTSCPRRSTSSRSKSSGMR
jgi:hypothetical protein